MNAPHYPIPGRINLCLAAGVVAASTTLLWTSSQVHSWWWVALIGICIVILAIMIIWGITG